MDRRKFLITGAGLVALLPLTLGCPTTSETVSVRTDRWTGKTFKMKRAKTYSINDWFLMYHGMPNKDTFSISSAGRSATDNFYRITEEEFDLYGIRFRLEEVTPQHITLTYLGKLSNYDCTEPEFIENSQSTQE